MSFDIDENEFRKEANDGDIDFCWGAYEYALHERDILKREIVRIKVALETINTKFEEISGNATIDSLDEMLQASLKKEGLLDPVIKKSSFGRPPHLRGPDRIFEGIGSRVDVTHVCLKCGSELLNLRAVRDCLECDPGAPPDLEGKTVKLDARGLKGGNAYIVATVRKVALFSINWPSIDPYHGGHEWHVFLDREVHLHECWGEGGGDENPFRHTHVAATYVLEEDLIDKNWKNVSDEFNNSYQPPYMRNEES